jgi:hypothetical protein
MELRLTPWRRDDRQSAGGYLSGRNARINPNCGNAASEPGRARGNPHLPCVDAGPRCGKRLFARGAIAYTRGGRFEHRRCSIRTAASILTANRSFAQNSKR